MIKLPVNYLISFIFLLTSLPFYAQDIPEDVVCAYQQIDPGALKAHMRFLADDMLEGRKPFTNGYKLAAGYVASEFEETGLLPAMGDTSYFQEVPLIIDKSEVSGKLVILSSHEEKTLTYGEDVILVSHPDSITPSVREIVFAGSGIQDPAMGFNDLNNLKMMDKFVILYYDLSTDKPYEFLLKHMNDNLINDIREAGAAGVILYIPPEMQTRFSWNRFRTYFQQKKYEASLSDFPVFLMDWKIVNEILQKSRPAIGSYIAGQTDPARFRIRASIRPEISIRQHQEIKKSMNVAAMLEGSDPDLKNEYFIYTAHLDHVGIGEPVDGDSIYNGAYDNASGISILIEMAKAFKRLESPPERSVLFIALTAEEMGLLGSEYYIEHPVVPLEKTAAMLNLDMFLMEKPLDEVVVLGESLSGLGQIAHRVCQLLDVRIVPDPLPEEKVFIRSDHFNFAKAGIPALFVINSFYKPGPGTTEPDPNYHWLKTFYHSPLDNFREDIHYDAGVKYAQINFLIGYLASNRKERIKWNFDF